MKDNRPEQYQYYKQLVDHVGGEDKFFNGSMIWPRQLEIHLPGDGRRSCVMNCTHCQGALFQHALGEWEANGLALLHDLHGRVPFHIYGGAYTEPVMNPYFPAYLGVTKFYKNHFGIHTSGSPLANLNDHNSILQHMIKLGEDKTDYISFSLDAASPASHKRGKGTEDEKFNSIINAIRILAQHQDRRMAVRICYLLNRWNSTEEEIDWIVSFAKRVGVDSLRFSIPYDYYLKTFDKVHKYREKNELPKAEKYRELLRPYLSESKSERTYIFYVTPEEGYTDITLYDFNQCIYGYYQITLGADGYLYKCSAISAPDMKHLRLGVVPNNANDLARAVMDNYDPDFDAQKMCFKFGGRCNRMAVECNRKHRDNKK